MALSVKGHTPSAVPPAGDTASVGPMPSLMISAGSSWHNFRETDKSPVFCATWPQSASGRQSVAGDASIPATYSQTATAESQLKLLPQRAPFVHEKEALQARVPLPLHERSSVTLITSAKTSIPAHPRNQTDLPK